MDPHREEPHAATESDLKSGLLGIALAVVGLAIIMGFSYWLAAH